jgi:hypothetical protein
MATFSVHFDGPITVNHRVPIRVLARTYEHMQRAIDRAYLIDLYGDVWKHARLTDKQYRETDFIAEYPREGGIILDAVRDGAGALLDRIAVAIRPVFESATQQAIEQQATMAVQLTQRREYVLGMRENTLTYEQVAADPPQNWANAYSNRSVIKEIDQLVTQVTPRQIEGSIVDITLNGNVAHLPFGFTGLIARRFHIIASQRELGAPLIVTARIRSLDRGNQYAKPSAKIENLSTNREVSLHLPRREDCVELHPYHNGEAVRLYVCPIIEALGFDIHGGDLLYLAVV